MDRFWVPRVLPGLPSPRIGGLLCEESHVICFPTWPRRRFAQWGFPSIERDAYRPGRIPAVDPTIVASMVEKTLHEVPAGATHWSAAADLATNGLKPHQIRTFKISRDPKVSEKLEDVVCLYLAPHEHAFVFCVDKKSRVQAPFHATPTAISARSRTACLSTGSLHQHAKYTACSSRGQKFQCAARKPKSAQSLTNHARCVVSSGLTPSVMRARFTDFDGEPRQEVNQVKVRLDDHTCGRKRFGRPGR